MLTANGGCGGSNQTGNPNEDEPQDMNNLVTSHQIHQVNNANGSTTFLYEYYKVPLPEKEPGSIQWRWVLNILKEEEYLQVMQKEVHNMNLFCNGKYIDTGHLVDITREWATHSTAW